MQMPKRVQIGTQVWQIIERSRTQDGMLYEDNFGYTLSKENVIVIDSQIASSRKRQTLMHELLHAIRFSLTSPVHPNKSAELDTWEHYFIAAYEEGLLLLLRNNPEVLMYLLEVE